MPARDGTGPAGQGPGTGRGLGNCNPRPSRAAGISGGLGGATSQNRPLRRTPGAWSNWLGGFFRRRRGKRSSRV